MLRHSLAWKIVPVVAGGALALGSSLVAHAQDAATLRYAVISEPSSLGLHQDASGATFIPLQAIYEPLLRLDQDMKLQPGLAESWQQLDEQTYEIKLREGVTFHSGNPLTAEDVKATFAWHINPDAPGYAAAYLNPIEEMTVKDELTLEIRLKAPYGPFPYVLTMPHTAISDMSKYAEIGAEGLRSQPSGTGPFQLESWNRGAELLLEAYPDYWGGEVPIERIQFRFVPEVAARAIALETGEIDIAESVAAPDIPRLVADPEINVVDAYELRAVLWIVNTHHEVLSDPIVRKALAHAIDYELAVSAILGEAARPLEGFVPPGTFGFADYKYAYDPEEAARLLTEAGWSKNGAGFYEKGGTVLSFSHVSGAHVAQEIQVAEAVQTLLREFGIDMQIEVLERVTHTTTMFDHAKAFSDGPKPDFGTTQWDHGIRTGDASVALDPIFTCGGPRNFGQFCDPAYDELIREAVSGLPAKEREARYAEAQAILFDAVAALPMWQPRISMAASADVANLQPTPTKVIYFDQLDLER